MAEENSKNELEPKVFPLDPQGRLDVTVSENFGTDNAGRRVRLSVDLLPLESEFRGSRKHILDLLDRSDWTRRLNDLIGIEEIGFGNDPCPTPKGPRAVAETDLDTYISNRCKGVWPEAEKQLAGGRWWAPYGGTRPQMDLICRCKINDKDGLLFVEAKAHERELDWGGKPLKDDPSEGSMHNHENISRQIEQASTSFNQLCGPGFNLSINSHYQLANRLAYLWKMGECGIPALLLYLGFTGDRYFADHLRNDRHWQRVMGGYMQGIVPHSFPEWRRDMRNGASIYVLVRSLDTLQESLK
jgi:hypothetical protein